jgi:hypothetical protein
MRPVTGRRWNLSALDSEVNIMQFYQGICLIRLARISAHSSGILENEHLLGVRFFLNILVQHYVFSGHSFVYGRLCLSKSIVTMCDWLNCGSASDHKGDLYQKNMIYEPCCEG